MTKQNKVFTLDSQFTKELPTADEVIDNIFISGYASVNSPDRAGDVVPSSVWEKGMENYLKNPVVLAYHDHDDPVGRMVEHKIDNKGLWIKARISAASEIFNLVKDGVLTAFSVSFKVNDAEYNSVTELFVIKELELIEISVVSVPCNQDTLFSLSKAFDTAEDYKLFKSQFVPKSESAKGLESFTDTNGTTSKEIGMDPKEMQAMLDAAAAKAAEAVTKSILDKQAAEKAATEKAAADEAAMQARISKALEAVTPSTTGTEKLLAEVEARIAKSEESNKSIVAGLEAVIKEKAAELEAIQKSKMTFKEGSKDDVPYAEKEKAFLLSKITGKSLQDTKFGKELVVKYGAHVPAGAVTAPQSVWELEVSTNLEAEIRRRLVLAPLFRNINMQTNVMKIPVNPEAGDATWMANTAFGTTDSPGAAQTHLLKEITLSAYKVATREYLAYEEEEDSIIIMLPIVRDAMVRRVSRAVDIAFLRGAGTGSDPVKGLALYDATSAATVGTASGKLTVANLTAARRDLGAWGLDPSEVTYIVSTEGYYDLLEDTNFQTMDKVGSQAVLLTGQIGAVGNSPVIVSSSFAAKATGANNATTNYAAIAVAAGNFIVGNQRGVRFDTQDLVETQRKVLVASLRTGLVQIDSDASRLGVSVVRWLNA